MAALLALVDCAPVAAALARGSGVRADEQRVDPRVVAVAEFAPPATSWEPWHYEAR